MKTVVLVMWFGTVHGGPSMHEFDSMAKCEAVREALIAEYLPDALVEPGWTTNTYHPSAAERSKCFEVEYG